MKKLFYLLALVLLASCGGKSTSPTASTPSLSESLNLNIMTYNIRYDNPEDSLNNWQYRKDIAAQIIKDQNIDIVGAQEVLANQLNDLKDRLPGYVAIGVGREDGKEKGEYSPILYNGERFTEIKSGYFWLSETPEAVGVKGWDAACERIATWAVLKDKVTEKEVFFINTHLDHVGKVARIEGVTLLLSRATELGHGLPVIMTGDYNADPESDVIKHVLDEATPGHLIHSKDIATTVSGLAWTFHDYDRLAIEKREFIDYIFVSKGIKVSTHAVLDEKLNDIFLSDHSPVVAQIEVQ